MFSRHALSYSRKDFLIVAAWWGLVAGLGEGLAGFYQHSPIRHDLMRAALIVNPLLFVGLALLIIVLNRRLVVRHELLVRATMGFGFLALYDCCDRLIPRAFDLLPFLGALAAAVIAAWIFHLSRDGGPRFHKWSLPLLAAVALWCIFLFPIQQRRKEAQELAQLPPYNPRARNVIVVLVDTLRADHLSGYGYSRPTSPELTRIAEEGVLFENAISASSWTLPSHASILTSLYPRDHHADAYTSNLGSGYPTLPEVLTTQGYRTGAFSANTRTFSRDRGFGRGFAHFEDDFQTLGSTFGRTFYGWKIQVRLCQLHIMRDLLGRPDAEEINGRALRWIDSGQRPFFVFLNYYDLHDPYLPPDAYAHKYTKVKHPGGRFSENWQWFNDLTAEERRGTEDAYDGAINYVDVRVADLMKELKRRGLDQDTLVIITADHGEGFYEHGLMNHGNSLYRELIHVPLIVWGPGWIPSGRKVTQPVSLTALPATVLDLLGDRDQRLFSGPSLKGLWGEGEPQGIFPPPISELAQLLWFPKYPNYYGPMQSVTTSQWHYITGGSTGELLFRCCGSMPETVNLANTAEGLKMCELFREELHMAATPAPDQRARRAGPAVGSHRVTYSTNSF